LQTHHHLNFRQTICNHPLVVSNTIIHANVSVTKMHRNMKDVVLFDSPDRIQESIAAVDQEDQKVYEYLDIIEHRILEEEGEK
jgi:hypothetical protein